jgi:hypothetical protein|nr:hypothetical protein [uncultured Lachnoclostridium sp.]
MFDDFKDFIDFIVFSVQGVFAFFFLLFLFATAFGGLAWLATTYGGDPDTTTIKQETVKGKVIESVGNSSISASFNIADMSVVEVTYEDAEGKEQKGYLLINKDSEVVVKDFYSDYEGYPLKGIILNEE